MTELLEPSVHRLLAHGTQVPVPAYVPWPMPAGWAVSGVGTGGDGASMIACSGPDLFDDVADIFIVCEEAGGTFGPATAGAAYDDGGIATADQAADVRITVDDHTTPLWRVPCGPDRDVMIGEAAGRWLWLVMFPDTTSLMVSDDFRLSALSTLLGELELVPMTGLPARRPW